MQTISDNAATTPPACHPLPPYLATHLWENGYDMGTVHHPLGHKDVKTTRIYNHVLNKRRHGVGSPMDGL